MQKLGSVGAGPVAPFGRQRVRERGQRQDIVSVVIQLSSLCEGMSSVPLWRGGQKRGIFLGPAGSSFDPPAHLWSHQWIVHWLQTGRLDLESGSGAICSPSEAPS